MTCNHGHQGRRLLALLTLSWAWLPHIAQIPDEASYVSAAKRDAFRALNVERALRCQSLHPLAEGAFTVRSYGLQGRGDKVSLSLQPPRGKAVDIILRAKDALQVDKSSVFVLEESRPPPCAIVVSDVGTPLTLPKTAKKTMLASVSLQWAEQHINAVRQEQCPNRGTIKLEIVGNASTKVISGVEMALVVKVYMPSQINIPADAQLTRTEHQILVRWVVKQAAMGSSPASAKAQSPSSRRLRRGAHHSFAESGSDEASGRAGAAIASWYGGKRTGRGLDTQQIPGAPRGMQPALLLPLSACELLTRSSLLRVVGPGVVAGADQALSEDDQGTASFARRLHEEMQNFTSLQRLFPGHASGAMARRLYQHVDVPVDEYDARSRNSQCYSGSSVVLNQGECSSAWAVAAVSATADRLCEANPAFMLQRSEPGGKRLRKALSVQRVLSCNSEGFGCSGGNVYSAFKAMMEDAGIVFGDAFPEESCCWSGYPESIVDLTMKDESDCKTFAESAPRDSWPCQCKSRTRQMPFCDASARIAGRVSNYYRLPTVLDKRPNSPEHYQLFEVTEWMQRELVTRGPFVVGFEVYEDFLSFDFSTGAVYACKEDQQYIGGHAAVILGWGKLDSWDATPYWLLRNSFGSAWGDRGHFRLERSVGSQNRRSCLVEQWMAVPEVAVSVATCDEEPWLGLHVASDLFRCRGTAVGQVCKVKCKEGYELQPAEGLRCTGNGRWAVAWCAQSECHSAPPVPHQVLSLGADACQHTRGGNACHVQCSAGYDATGSAQCVEGQWRVVPTCEARFCDKAPSIINAGPMNGCAGRPHGGTCEVQCQAGFAKTRDVECIHGVFEAAQCIPLSCAYAPGIEHCVGCEQGVGSPSGAEVPIECEVGYTKSANPGCISGHWSRVICKPNSCNQVPIIERAMDLSHCQGTPDSERCWFHCQQGFHPNGVLACSLGEWTMPKCESQPVRRPCPHRPNIANSRDLWNCRGLQSGEICPFGCKDGYRPVGELLCVSGVWTHARCEGIPCDSAPFIEHASGMSACKGMTPGSKCTVTCDAGYKATFPYVTCRNAAWDTAPRCMPSKCAAVPTISHVLNDLTSCRNASAGTRCTFECLNGYEAQGELICIDGNWNSPICSPLTCQHVPYIEHAENLKVCAGLASGSKCEVVCHRGYRKRADLFCMNGKWTSDAAVCEPMACLQIPLVPNAVDMGICRGMPSGGACPIQCANGYYNTGGNPMCRNGDWHLTDSVCIPRPCDDSPVLMLQHSNANEMQRCIGSVSGQVCPLVCESGYQKTGDLMCYLGQWMTAGVRCVPGKQAELQAARSWMLQPDRVNPLPNGSIFPLRSALARRSCTGYPHAANAEDLSSCAGRQSGATCSIHCKVGYEKTSDVWCIDGAWMPLDARCEPLRCRVADLFVDRAVIPRGIECDGMPSGSLCPFRCEEGFACNAAPSVQKANMSLQQLDAGTCTATCINGGWVTEDSQCTERPCESVPQISYADPASLDACRGTSAGRVCRFTCRSGWHPSSDLTCSRGSWSKGACVPNACQKSQGSNPSISTACPGASHGGQHLVCQRGLYVGIAQSAGDCNRCITPPDIPHAKLAVLQCTDAASGSSCPVFCEEGYQAHLSKVLCQDGSWQQAICEPRSCATPPAVDKSIAGSSGSCTGIASGSSCTLHCNTGYVKTGDFICNRGKFNGPRCHPSGYLGHLRIDLAEDMLTAAAVATPPGWQLKKIAPHLIQNATIPSVAMRTSNEISLMDDAARQIGLRLDLPAVYIGPKGGTITFSWRVDSELAKDLLHFAIDDQMPGGFSHSGSTGWQRATFSLPPGHHTCTWTYVKDDSVSLGEDAAWIANITFDNAALLAVYLVPFHALQVAQTGSSASWQEVSAETPSGEWGSVFMSGDLGEQEPEDNACIDMTLPEVDISSPHGVVSFFFRTSSELNFDVLRFLVDGVEQRTDGFPQSGLQQRWHLASFRLASGKHSLTWRYEKDGKGRAGDDVVYVAEIKVRNMKVAPVKLVEHVHVTHASGDLASKEYALTNTLAAYFGVPQSMTAMKFIELAEFDANTRTVSTATTIPGDVRAASLYKFYDAQISVSCGSSTSCANISATMASLREKPIFIKNILHSVLEQAMVQVLRVSIDDVVVGEVEPGLAMSSVPGISRLYRDRKERKSFSTGVVGSLFARLHEGDDTTIIGLIATALLSCYFAVRSLRRDALRHNTIRLDGDRAQSMSLVARAEAEFDIE